MSKFTIDIDTGGTFTDGFFTYGEKFETVKVDTTPHDLTVCFNNCINEGAKRFGFENTDEFLRQTKMIRLSTTVGTNSLIQKSGPKLGLIVTKGYEETLYQENNPILHYLVEPELVIGINESVSKVGIVELEPNEDELRKATKTLLEAGARAFVVSLKNSHLNMANEKRIREFIQADFPTHYLGAKSILLSGEISRKSDDGIRTNAGVVNAYLHRDMVKYLYKADDGIRTKGFPNHLLIAHSNGGVARVAKTKAIDTYNSGPAAGLMGSAYTGTLYGINNILTFDVGGTSTDVGVIKDGKYTFDNDSTISGIPVHTPLIHVLSVGGGGGSIAKVNKEGKVQIGPESSGAIPGPACFDLGGTNPTVTDAAVALKWVDPNYFLGGKKKLNEKKANDAIESSIATKLNIPREEAAFQIIDELTTIGANALKQLTAERGYKTNEFLLFSFGGGGGLFSAEVARKSGIKRVYTFPFSSVFSAYGLSTADINHVYEVRTNINIQKEDTNISESIQYIRKEIEKMRNWAYRDMRGEGFEAKDVQFQVELESIIDNGARSKTLSLPLYCTEDEINTNQIEKELLEQSKFNKYMIEFIQIKAWANIPHYHFVELPLSSSNPADALKEIRTIGWAKQSVEAKIYNASLLKPGNVIVGPAIIESNDTTILVPPNATYRVDKFSNGILEV